MATDFGTFASGQLTHGICEMILIVTVIVSVVAMMLNVKGAPRSCVLAGMVHRPCDPHTGRRLNELCT